MTTRRQCYALIALVFFAAVPLRALAQDDRKEAEKKLFEPRVTEHEVTVRGRVIRYRVTAGLSPLMDDDLKTKARVFSIAYERLADGDAKDATGKPMTLAAQDPGKRAITFAFNGGPGSSSVWLHLGALGPRRVKMGDAEGAAPPVPGALMDNEETWLEFTDLVFIDPVSTGYSRPAEGEDPNQFHGLDEDVRWVGEFIRLYLVRSQRWLSPKFLAGESYGTTRAAGLSGHLQGALGINLNGIVLVSPVLNFATISFDNGNDLPYWLFLPSYTATAFYHKKLPPPWNQDLDTTLKAAAEWARTDYLQALAKGGALSAQERDAIADKLATFTGLSVEYVKRANLRIPEWEFFGELLRGEGKTIGRYDSRYTGINRNGNAASHEYDPSYSAVQGAFTACLNAYIRGELNFESDLNYEILTGRVHPWNFGRNRYADVSETLRSAMTQNPSLRVLACDGYYDLATPFLAMTYTADHMGLDPTLRGHLTQSFFHAGHMMYLREEDLKKLHDDAAKFYEAAVGEDSAQRRGGG